MVYQPTGQRWIVMDVVHIPFFFTRTSETLLKSLIRFSALKIYFNELIVTAIFLFV